MKQTNAEKVDLLRRALVIVVTALESVPKADKKMLKMAMAKLAQVGEEE